jgi:hypothetical protein
MHCGAVLLFLHKKLVYAGAVTAKPPVSIAPRIPVDRAAGQRLEWLTPAAETSAKAGRFLHASLMRH